MHKYHIGEEVSLQVNDWANQGNGDWASGKVVAQVFLNGKPGYDVLDNISGIIIHSVPEEFKE